MPGLYHLWLRRFLSQTLGCSALFRAESREQISPDRETTAFLRGQMAEKFRDFESRYLCVGREKEKTSFHAFLSSPSMRRLQNEGCSPPRLDISSVEIQPCCGLRSLPPVKDADTRLLAGCGQRRNTPNSIGCAVKCGMKRRNADEYDQSTECRVPV